jgi:hypothetical protein
MEQKLHSRMLTGIIINLVFTRVLLPVLFYSALKISLILELDGHLLPSL